MIPSPSLRRLTWTIALALNVWPPPPLHAEGLNLQGAATQPVAEPAAGEIALTLDEAVRRAIERNADLAIVRLEPEAGTIRVAQAESAFRPVLSTALGMTRVTTPPTSSLFGDSGVENTDWFGSGTLRQRLLTGGGTWLASWDAQRTTTNSPLSSYNPDLGSSLLLAFSQPLLRDREIDAARQQLIVTRRNKDISDLQFKEAVVQTTASVKTAYWDLKATLANVAVQQRSLELAEELARQNKARVDVGQLPPLDLLAAQAEAAQRREQLIEARRLAGDSEDRLRRLIMDPADRSFWNVRLSPVDEPRADEPTPDVDAAIAATLTGRLDLEQARKLVENAVSAVRFYQNQRRPDVRLEASYAPTGLGGTQLIRNGFLGDIIGRNQTSFGSTLGQILTGDYPSWSVGLTVNYALGRSYEDAGLARAEIDRRQAEARVSTLELQAVEELRRANRTVGSARERIDATRVGAELAEERLQVEQRRFEVGLSTSFLVTQAQRDLAQARVAQLQAMLDFQSALIAFELLRQAPALSSATSLGLNGATVVALPPGQPRGIAPASGTGGF
ncbi:MAG: TolC family protein [Vicinamibacterales bacterium]